MYVKIIKCSDDNYSYNKWIGHIFNVKKDNDGFIWINNKNESFHMFAFEDCEEINLDFDGKISEEFADKLMNNICISAFKVESEWTKKKWIKLGFIKQSREDELRAEIEKIDNSVPKNSLETLLNMVSKQEELIEILDNKLKEVNNE